MGSHKAPIAGIKKFFPVQSINPILYRIALLFMQIRVIWRELGRD